MVGVTRSLRRTLAGIIFVYTIAAIIAVSVSVYFLSTPNKRRQVIVGQEQVHVALSIGVLMMISSCIFIIGITSQKAGGLSLKIFNLLNLCIMIMTLCLGAYAWFQSLNIQGSYKDRWMTWPESARVLFQDEGSCCGYENVTDYPALTGYCTKESISQTLIQGCAKSMYNFVIGYLSNIYTALFLFTCVNFVSLMGSLVLLRAQEDQRRYEKSMRKMINLHHLDNDQHMAEYPTYNNNNLSAPALPQYSNRVSVLYSSK